MAVVSAFADFVERWLERSPAGDTCGSTGRLGCRYSSAQSKGNVCLALAVTAILMRDLDQLSCGMSAISEPCANAVAEAVRLVIYESK